MILLLIFILCGVSCLDIQVTKNENLGNAKFVLIPSGIKYDVKRNEDHLKSFLRYNNVLGIRNFEEELVQKSTFIDSVVKSTNSKYIQYYKGIPVFGGQITTVEKNGELSAISGTFVPDINVDITPSFPIEKANSIAIAAATKLAREEINQDMLNMEVPLFKVSSSGELVIFRTNIQSYIPGSNHLAFKIVVVSQNKDFRYTIMIDAQKGIFLKGFSNIHSLLNRRVDQLQLGDTIWVEGDPPSNLTYVNTYLNAMNWTYQLFNNSWKRDGFDNRGSQFIAVNGAVQLNAYWDEQKNATFYDQGLATIDVVSHEFGHAYTSYTDNLIYVEQSGALNEAYSDIIGSTVSLLFNPDYPQPDILRTNLECTSATKQINITSPLSMSLIVQTYFQMDWPVGNNFELVFPVDINGSRYLCNPLNTSLSGKVALIAYYGTCGNVGFRNAVAAGAIGVIFFNENGPPSGPYINTTVFYGAITNEDAQYLINLNQTVNFTATLGTQNSTRWLIGLGTTLGAIRDMWNPNCFADPSFVTSLQYYCGLSDNGGVHSNSGIPNKAYASLVDGTTFNGILVQGIGFTKAFMIYSRAMIVYMNPYTDFLEHADALYASCVDLIGIELNDLVTGMPSGINITEADCFAVNQTCLATGLRNFPNQCNFSQFFNPFPEKNYCSVSSVNGEQNAIFSENFDVEPSGWTAHAFPVNSTSWIPRNWTWIFQNGTDEDAFSGYFAPNPITFDCENSQSGLLNLDSPEITIPSSSTIYIQFTHLMDVEPLYDGGIILLSINGGDFIYLSNKDAVINGYPSPPLSNSTNPLAGVITYSGGLSRPSLIPTWGTSIFTFNAEKNDVIKVRFSFGTDECGGTNGGWSIADFQVYSCSNASSKLSTGQIVGIVIGVIIFVAIVVLIVVVIIKRNKSAEKQRLLP